MKKLTTAAVAAALFAVPAMSVEAKPSKPGSSGKSERKAQGNSKRCAKPHRLGFVVRGTLASSDATSVTLNVVGANRHARRYLESSPATFSTAGAKLSFEGVTDSSGNGTVGLEDVAASDRIVVIGKLATPKKRCTGTSSLAVRKIAVHRETENEVEQPAPEAPPAS